MVSSKYIVFVLTFAHLQHVECKSNCKVTPSSPDWPSRADWHALNQSVSGRLIAPVPPGVVCHPERPEFNNQSCSFLTQQWTNTSLHGLDPVSVNYNDDTCLPSSMAPCSSDGYPSYVIAAINEKDIQEGVRFAHRTGVRLIVKATGHDYLSRYYISLPAFTIDPHSDHLPVPRVEAHFRSGHTTFAESKSP